MLLNIGCLLVLWTSKFLKRENKKKKLKRSACVADRNDTSRLYIKLHFLWLTTYFLYWNRFKFSLWYIALQIYFHIDQFMYQFTPTNTYNKCKKIEILLAFTFVFTVWSLQIWTYMWLISKSRFNSLNCMIIRLCFSLWAGDFCFNSDHLLKNWTWIFKNSMQ